MEIRLVSRRTSALTTDLATTHRVLQNDTKKLNQNNQHVKISMARQKNRKLENFPNKPDLVTMAKITIWK